MSLNTKVRTAVRVLQNFGILEVIKIMVRKIFRLDRLLLPESSLGSNFSKVITFSGPSEDFLIACGQSLSFNDPLRNYQSFLDRVSHNSKKPRMGFFDEIYDLGPGLGFLLFNTIETEMPKKILETGIAAGASSILILSKLKDLEHGTLISIDITSKVGELVEEQFRNRWIIKVLPILFRRKAFLRILNSNQDAIIFLHDSDHSIDWQIFEISSVIKLIPDIKHILVDDVTLEFESYVLENLFDWRLVVINEGRKFSGYLSRK